MEFLSLGPSLEIVYLVFFRQSKQVNINSIFDFGFTGRSPWEVILLCSLKGQCHEIYRLKWICLKVRFRGDIGEKFDSAQC